MGAMISEISEIEMNEIDLVYEMNEMKVTKQICKTSLSLTTRNSFTVFFFESCNWRKYLLSLKYKNHIKSFLQYVAFSIKSYHILPTYCFVLLSLRSEVKSKSF